MKKYIISLVASSFLIILSSPAHGIFYADMPKEGINYHLPGNGGKITYFGEQCPLNQPSCKIDCRPSTNLVPGCFNLSKVRDDIKHLKLMGVKHVRLIGPHIYVFMNWSREKGYISFDHPHYGSQMIDNFRQVIDLFHQNGIKLTIGLMGIPPGAGIPNVSESHFFYQFFQCFENTKDKVHQTLIPKYPDKHNNLKKAPADFIDMFKDHPAIVTWTTFGEVNEIFYNYAGIHDDTSRPIKIAWNYFKNYFLDMRQRIESLQWPGGTRKQNLGVTWCCYKENAPDFVWEVLYDLVDFYLFSYYDDTGKVEPYNQMPRGGKEVGFSEHGSSASCDVKPVNLVWINRKFNVKALRDLWQNMDDNNWYPKIYNPWSFGETTWPPWEWQKNVAVRWMMDGWALRTLYRTTPSGVANGQRISQVYFLDTYNYYTITDGPQLVGIPQLMKIGNIQIANCWNRSIAPLWYKRCCCQDINNCDCSYCKEGEPCLKAAPPPQDSHMVFDADSLICSTKYNDTSTIIHNDIRPQIPEIARHVMFYVDLTSYDEKANVIETTAKVKNLDVYSGARVDYCFVNNPDNGLAGHGKPIEIRIVNTTGSINIDIDYVYAGYKSEGGELNISAYKVTPITPTIIDNEFIVNLTDIVYYENVPFALPFVFRGGRLNFDYVITETPLLFRMVPVYNGVVDTDEDGIPDVEDNCPYENNPGQEASDGDGLGDACGPPLECQSNEDCPGMEYCKKMDGDCEGIEICAPIPDDCPDYWAPVCGCDGLTYSSDREAAFTGVSIEHHGRCEDSIVPCSDNANCQPDEFCYKGLAGCSANGACEPMPSECPDYHEPVCSCSNNTYENYCLASMVGENAASEGECWDLDSDGISNILDNCPSNYNPDHADSDHDTIGDICDSCPFDPNNDSDGDGICGDLDNCPIAVNPDQNGGDNG